MFNNPLRKYAAGGNVDEARVQVIQAISELTGADPEDINNTLDQIAGDQKAIEALGQALSAAKNGDQRGIEVLQKMFPRRKQSQFAKKGGKLHDFICKHANGGQIVRCGCKEDGGKVEKAQLGTTAPTYLYNENGHPVEMNERTSRDGRVLIQETPTSVGEATHLFNSLSANAGGYAFPIEYNMQRLHMLGDGAMSIQPIRGFERDLEAQKINRWKTPNMKPNPDAKENGDVVKGQKGTVTPTLSHREALAAAKNTFGFSGSQARRAYANAKKGLRAQGLRGSELKQRAREMMFNMPTIDDEITIDTIEEPQIQLPELPVLDTNTPSIQSIQPIQDTNPLAGMTDEQLAKAVMAGKYGNGAARRNALGDRYAAVQQIINRGFSKPVTPTVSTATLSSVATPTTTTPIRTSVSNNAQKVLTSSSTTEPAVITATVTPSSTSPVGTASTQSYGLIYGNIPGGFVPQNTPEGLGFRINSNRPVSSFGARQSIINRQVKDYIDSAGLGIRTDIIFDNGRYIWRNSGTPVEVPMVGRNGNYRPAVERNGGVVKGQDGSSGLSITPADSSKVKYSTGKTYFGLLPVSEMVSFVDNNGDEIYLSRTLDESGFNYNIMGGKPHWSTHYSPDQKISEKKPWNHLWRHVTRKYEPIDNDTNNKVNNLFEYAKNNN